MDLTVAVAKTIQEVTAPVSRSTVLGQFPLLSVELMNLEQLSDKLQNPSQLKRLTRDLMVRMESQLLSQSATIESIRDNVIFFSFRQEKGLNEAIAKALKVAIALAQKTINLQGVAIRLRVGMDVIQTDEQGPMTAVPERLIAQPGQAVVSFNVYQMTNKQLPYESIGPIKVQGQMRTFFKIMMGGGGAAVKKQSQPESPQKTDETVSAAPSEPMAQQAQAEPAQEPVDPPPPTDGGGIERKFEPPEAPGAITYSPPEFLGYQAVPKKGNVGYEQALRLLEAEIQELVDNHDAKGKIIGLCGVEGAGKSTIVNMVRGQMSQDAVIWVGGSFYEAYGNNRFPLLFWLELVQNLLGFPVEGIPKPQGEEHMRKVLQSIYGEHFSEDKMAFAKTLLSFDPLQPITPEVRQNLGQMIPHIQGFLQVMAQVRPLVLIMEDVDYADAASIELLLQMFQNDLLGSRIAVLMTYTPHLLFMGPLQQAMNLMPFKEIVLGPCEESTLVTLAQTPLAVAWKKLPDSLRGQILEKGSPMFLEEAFRWLYLKEGFSIQAKTGKFNPEKKLKDLHVPEDLGQIVLERLEGLDQTCLTVLQTASVIGERFSTVILADLTQIQEQFEDILKLLWQYGFIFPDSGSMARFRHSLIWQAVYNSIPAETRQKLHQFLGDYYAQVVARDFAFCPVWGAYQYTVAQQYEQAAYGWNQAAAWLAQVGTVTGANIAFLHMQQAMQAYQAEPDPRQQLQLYESLAFLNVDIQPEYAKNLLLTALQFQGNGNLEEQVKLEVFLAQAYENLGAYTHATSTIHRTLEKLPQEGSEVERIALGCREVWYLYIQGRFQEALYVYDEIVKPGLLLAGQTPWTDPAIRESYFQQELARARIALWQCNSQAFDIVDKTLIKCDVQNEQILAIHLRLTRSLGMLLKGQYQECQREMEQILAEAEELGHPADVMVWWGVILLMYHCDMGDWENASLLVPNVSYQAEQARDYLAWNLCQALAGRISVANGNYGEAQKILEQTVTVAAEYHLSHPALMGWRFIAENDLNVDNLDVAEQICMRAIEIAQKPAIQNLYELYWLSITHAKIMLKRKQFKEAGALLERHWPAIVKTGYTPLIAEAAFQISELYGKLSQDLPEPHQSKYRAQQESFLQKAKTLWTEQGNKYRLTPYLKEQSISIPE